MGFTGGKHMKRWMAVGLVLVAVVVVGVGALIYAGSGITSNMSLCSQEGPPPSICDASKSPR